MQLYNTKVVPSTADVLWSAPALPEASNAKLLVISTPFASGSTGEQTLQKMMAACKLSASEYVVWQMGADEQYSWQSVAGAVGAPTILLLGITPARLAIHALFRLHALNAFSGRTFIPALSLAEIEGNPAAKKELWTEGLKPAFGL